LLSSVVKDTSRFPLAAFHTARLDDADRHANADIVMQDVGRALSYASHCIGVGEDVLLHKRHTSGGLTAGV
jgi:hypothetical protein